MLVTRSVIWGVPMWARSPGSSTKASVVPAPARPLNSTALCAPMAAASIPISNCPAWGPPSASMLVRAVVLPRR